MISKTKKWAAKVVYGDTDSVFVMVPNRSKEEAFRIGNEIVEAVTNDNPKPVKLKLEKVYYPCILQVGVIRTHRKYLNDTLQGRNDFLFSGGWGLEKKNS